MKIDHYGIVVRSIKDHVEKHFKGWMDTTRLGAPIHEPLQKVNVAFLQLDGGRLELIEPTSEDSPVSVVLKNNVAQHHHVCFTVADLDAQLEKCVASGMLVVSAPKPSVAFGGRRIAFVMGRDRLLWELVEA